MKCEIIQDLLPCYMDGLASPASSEEIERHICQCPACAEAMEMMKSGLPPSAEEIQENKRDIRPLRTLRKRVNQAICLTVLICFLAAGIYGAWCLWTTGADSKDFQLSYGYNEEYKTIEISLGYRGTGRLETEYMEDMKARSEGNIRQTVFLKKRTWSLFNRKERKPGKTGELYIYGVGYKSFGSVSQFVQIKPNAEKNRSAEAEYFIQIGCDPAAEGFRPFTEQDVLVLEFQDTEKEIHLKETAEDLGLQ